MPWGAGASALRSRWWGFPGGAGLQVAGGHRAHLPPRGHPCGFVKLPAGRGCQYAPGGAAPARPETSGLCRAGGGPDWCGNPLVLPCAHSSGGRFSLCCPGTLPLRRRGGLCGGNYLRGGRRHPGGGGCRGGLTLWFFEWKEKIRNFGIKLQLWSKLGPELEIFLSSCGWLYVFPLSRGIVRKFKRAPDVAAIERLLFCRNI